MDRDGFANFFLGLGVGLGIGLLFAPRSGEETRQLLKEKADEGTDFLKKQTADLRENAAGLANGLVDKSKEALNRQRDSVAEAMAAGRQADREKVEEGGQPA